MIRGGLLKVTMRRTTTLGEVGATGIGTDCPGPEREHIINRKNVKDSWDVLKWFYEGRRQNRKFMDGYLHTGREKMSELARIGTKLDIDVKLAILVNGSLGPYSVTLELKKWILTLMN
jgi:hypothetical protein